MKTMKLLILVAGGLAMSACGKSPASKGYTVEFNTHGGTLVETMVNVTKISTSPETARDGYTFLGWYESALPSATKYEFPYTVRSDMTMHARWEQIGYTVTFETDGGTPVSPMTTTLISEKPVSTKEGYKLTGWYTSLSSESPISFPYVVDHNQTLYAKWIVADIDGYMDENIITQQVKTTKVRVGSGDYYADIYGAKIEQGLYFYVEQFVAQGMSHSSNWWQNNNIEFRFGNEILLPDGGGTQYWFSSINGGEGSHGKMAFVDAGKVSGLNKYQFEILLPWSDLEVRTSEVILFSAGCAFYSGWATLSSWNRVRADQLNVFNTISTTGFSQFSGLGSNFFERTGRELLSSPVSATRRDDYTWDTNVVKYLMNGTNSWELRLDLHSSWADQAFNDCGWAGEVYAEGGFSVGGWTFRQDWWGWASWSKGGADSNAGPHGDFIDCTESNVFEAMREKDVTIFVKYDASLGRIAVRGVYTSTYSSFAGAKVFIAYSSDIFNYSGNMYAAFGFCNGGVTFNSVQLISGSLAS